jgi:hypothetical protein
MKKVGLSLDLDSIPSEYEMGEQVKAHESQFWQQKNGNFWNAGIDTTFAMRRASDPIEFETGGRHLRTDRPYTAIHWPRTWSQRVVASSDEIRHYIQTTVGDGLHWTRLMREQAG